MLDMQKAKQLDQLMDELETAEARKKANGEESRELECEFHKLVTHTRRLRESIDQLLWEGRGRDRFNPKQTEILAQQFDVGTQGTQEARVQT